MAMTLSRYPALSVEVMEIQTSGGEIIGILKKINDADLADSHHASLDAAKKQDIVKQDIVTVTILTNLLQGEAVVKEEVVMLTVTIVTNHRQGEAEEKEEVATETESATRESVVLVPDAIVSAPWSVLLDRQDTPHEAASACFLSQASEEWPVTGETRSICARSL